MVNSRKVKARIVELGFTQDDVAENIGMDVSTFNQKINNKRRIYIDEVAKLCDYLKINTTTELQEYFGLDFLTNSGVKDTD